MRWPHHLTNLARAISETLLSSLCAGTEPCDSPAGELTEEELLVRAVIMFLGGKGHPGRSGCGSAASKATNKLVHLARAVLFEIALR